MFRLVCFVLSFCPLTKRAFCFFKLLVFSRLLCCALSFFFVLQQNVHSVLFKRLFFIVCFVLRLVFLSPKKCYFCLFTKRPSCFLVCVIFLFFFVLSCLFLSFWLFPNCLMSSFKKKTGTPDETLHRHPRLRPARLR